MKNSNYGFLGNIEEQSKLICDCLGYGKNDKAHFLLKETACAESGAGKIKDRTIKAGMGICQIDNCLPYHPFDDIKKRSLKYRDKILKDLDIDLNLVEWQHLRYNTFLSLLFCRLFYLPVNGEIPGTLKGRASYWKKHYNTEAGKGTESHYLYMVSKYYKDEDKSHE